MKFAVLTSDHTMVDNVIVAREDQKQELEVALGRVLMDAASLGLQIGDLFNGANWTRNVDGEQIVLPLEENPDVNEVLDIIERGE